ncbi:MAG: hypothetical protein GY757_35190 [bacterium]|nr:hypothetical protein [bacterium]
MKGPKKQSKKVTKQERDRARLKNLFRYYHGIEFTRATRNEFLSQIKQGKANLVKKQTLSRFLMDVQYDGKKYRVVYNPKKKNLRTVFPEAK